MSAAPSEEHPPVGRLMKPSEVAPLFDVKASTVKGWARTGRIAAVRTPGGEWRVYESEVESLRRPASEPPAIVDQDSSGVADFGPTAAEQGGV